MLPFHVTVPQVLDLFPHDVIVPQVSVTIDTSDEITSQNIDLQLETFNTPETTNQHGSCADLPPISAEDDEVSSKLTLATVVNLSDVVLTPAQISLLEKGI